MKQIKKYPGLMKSYLKNWNGMRTLRLVLGVFVTLQASLSGDWLFILLGVLFSLLSVFNVAGAGGRDQL
jgi:succinate-acetate transporter protein